jgi:hypothetical protein
VIVFDSQGRLVAAHRGNSRADIFDQDGQRLPRENVRPAKRNLDRKERYSLRARFRVRRAPGKDTSNPVA